MAVNHKFIQTNFGQGFSTDNAILSSTPVKPKILFLGTFNPDTPDNVNIADFYYGRNWFWPGLFNIITHNALHYTRQRKFSNPLDPTRQSILEFCEKYQITFADLIDKVLHADNIQYELNRNIAIVGNEEYDLINDGDLGDLNDMGQVSWTTKRLIEYLQQTASINTVYLTRKPVEPYTTQWNQIKSTNYGREISFRKIFTPSGQGLKGRPRMKRLINHWIFNEDPTYNQLDREWLTALHINTNEFV